MKTLVRILFLILLLVSPQVNATAPSPEKSEELGESSENSITVRFVGLGIEHPYKYHLPGKIELSEALQKLKFKPWANGHFKVSRMVDGNLRVFKFKVDLRKTPFPSTHFELLNGDEIECYSEMY